MAGESSVPQSQRTLITVFAVLYFVQGTAEPTAGLVAQPVRSLLRSWGLGADGIAQAMFIIGFPWYVKPLFGLLTDFVPIRGLRRKSYLLLTSTLSLVGLVGAALLPIPDGAVTLLVLLLLLPCVGITFGDVVTDGYMIDTGKPRGLTGRLQSAQWTAIYAAGLLTGVAGGYLSQHELQRVGFLICGLLGAVTFYVALRHVHEPSGHVVRTDRIAHALRSLRAAMRNRAVIVVAAFLFFVNFNPFSADVLYVHVTETIGLSEQLVGTTYTISSAGSILAGVLYGVYAPRIPVRRLVHASIAFMVISSLVYLGLRGPISALVVSALFGFFYLVTTLTQLDLAARYAPSASAGTIFASLMAISNLAVSVSSVVGGHMYASMSESLGTRRAYTVLVLVGSGFTAACWLLYRFFPKEEPVDA